MELVVINLLIHTKAMCNEHLIQPEFHQKTMFEALLN